MITEKVFIEYQSRLGENSYLDNICIMQGQLPVLISVPHAVPHLRNDECRNEELNTDVLGFILHEHTGCHLFINAGVDGDPNDDRCSLYKEKLLQYIRQHKIAMIIDLHGASAARPFDYELGTAGGRNVAGFAECVSSFIALSHLEGMKTTVDEYFPANAETRVSSYVNSQASIPALQLEINRNLRDTYSSVCSTARLLTKYVNGISDLLIYNQRISASDSDGGSHCRLMWVTKADIYVPRNLVLLPEELNSVFGINENINLLFNTGQEDFVIKGFGAPKGCVAITGQMISRYGCENSHLLMNMSQYSTHSILKPQAEDIDNEYVLLSDDLLEKYNGYGMLEILNPVDNLRAYFKIKKYGGNVNKRTDSVWLSYYQRKLLGIETPPILARDYMLVLLSHMNSEDAEFFKSQYLYDELHDCYMRTSSNVDMSPRLRTIWNNIYSKVRFRGVKASSKGINQGYLMENLIRKKILQFRAARCAEKNEIVDAVFITKSSSIVLGVSELDYVWITYENKSIRTKIIIIEKEDYSKIVKANCLKSEEDVDMLVCIPMKLRSKLGLYEPGCSVMIERSVKDLFIKNAFAQLMTLLGLFIAIVTIPNLSVLHKAIVFVVLGPLIMYSVLAGERNKI